MEAELREGEAILFIDRKEREYLRVLRGGARISLRGGTLLCNDLIGQEEGRMIHNSQGEPFWVFRPTYARLIPNLPRRAQVIYPKDVGPILLWGDIYPGATALEVGAGPGALTIALLRAVGKDGRVISYENRADFIPMARENVERFYGPAPHWTIKLADASEGIEERNIDRMVLDVPEPWRLLDAAAASLRPGGVLVGFVPTVLQIKNFVEGLRQHRGFATVQVMETLVRFWHVAGLSVRPEHRMVAHTGFVMVARRVKNS